MITKLRHWWREMRASFWFVPAVMVVGAVGLAACLISVDTTFELSVEERWPLVFGSGAEGARGLLAAVAGSMITVAGVVFSVTIVALSLSSSQYTSRILRNFMRDRRNQVVLGVFVGIFAYCLIVLRTIHGGDEVPFVPSLAVLGGLILAFIGIGHLIFFIHHISVSIQGSSIVAAAATETTMTVDRLFPDELDDGADQDVEDQDVDTTSAASEGRPWVAIEARKTGYVARIDADALLEWARERGAFVRMECATGDFVVEGTPLASVFQPGGPDEKTRAELNRGCVISRHRTVEEDVAFGIRQIVDVALKALSPGVNDTTTAVICVDYLGAIFLRLAARKIGPPHRLDDGEVRVIARGPSFTDLLAEGFDEIRQNAEGNVAILTCQLGAIETIASRTSNAHRRQALRHHADLITKVADRTIAMPHDMEGITAASARAMRALGSTR